MYFTCILFCLFMDVYYMYFFICYVQCFGNMSKYVMPIKQYELRERERERERGGVTLDKKNKNYPGGAIHLSATRLHK